MSAPIQDWEYQCFYLNGAGDFQSSKPGTFHGTRAQFLEQLLKWNRQIVLATSDVPRWFFTAP